MVGDRSLTSVTGAANQLIRPTSVTSEPTKSQSGTVHFIGKPQ